MVQHHKHTLAYPQLPYPFCLQFYSARKSVFLIKPDHLPTHVCTWAAEHYLKKSQKHAIGSCLICMTANIKQALSTANNVLQSLVSWISYSHSVCFPLSSNLVIPSLITQRTIFILAKAHNELATCFNTKTKAIRRDFYVLPLSHLPIYLHVKLYSMFPPVMMDELSVLLRTTLPCAHSTTSNLPEYPITEIIPSSLLYYMIFHFYCFISINLQHTMLYLIVHKTK